MTFEIILEQLRNGKTMEQITNETMVECVGNEVYEDEDLYEFMRSIGVKIEDFGTDYAIISTNEKEKYYEIPYEERENRFGNDMPVETILFFDINRIYDVTEYY